MWVEKGRKRGIGVEVEFGVWQSANRQGEVAAPVKVLSRLHISLGYTYYHAV